MNSDSFLEDLYLDKRARRVMYNKGLEHVQQYPFIDSLSHREIQARALDLNYTIQATNNFLFGAYNSFNRGPELPFEIGDPRTFPPEPLSFDPKEVINFKTALPFGLQFIPVLSSSSKHELKLMLADQTCPKWQRIVSDRLSRANDRLSSNAYFLDNIKKIEAFLGIDRQKSFTKQANSSVIQKCYKLKLQYWDVAGSKKSELSEESRISSELEEFLNYCEAFYWLLKLDDRNYSRLQATPFYDKIKRYVSKAQEIQKKDQTFTLKKTKRFFLLGGHLAHLLSQLINIGILKGQQSVYYKLLTTKDHQKRAGLKTQVKPWIPEASTLNFEFYTVENQELYVRVVYNHEPLDFCGLKNMQEKFKCSLPKFYEVLDRFSDHGYKKDCGMHLKHKIPELKKADQNQIWPNIVLCLLILLTVIFTVVGWFVRKRYKHLVDLIETELGSAHKKNN